MTTPTARLTAKVVDPIADARWLELVAASPDAEVFHHPAWLRVLREQYRYPVHAWCVEGDDGELAAGLPVAVVRSRLTGSRAVAIPFSDRCAAVHRSSDPTLARALGDCVEQERRSLGLDLEIHGPPPPGPVAYAGERFFHHVIGLEDGLEAALARVHASKRRAARRATRLEVSVVRRTDRAALRQFFRLHVLTRQRHGVPTQPRRFFDRLVELFAQGMGFVLLAQREGQAVAAAVYLRYRDVLTYKFGASDPDQLNLRANVLVFEQAIVHAQADGCRLLDLGRTELDNPGLRAFKAQFGSDERTLEYAWLGTAPKGAGVRSVSELQKGLIRRAPPAVGRVLGAAVYRHFA